MNEGVQENSAIKSSKIVQCKNIRIYYWVVGAVDTISNGCFHFPLVIQQ
jgi:hypothetical protein